MEVSSQRNKASREQLTILRHFNKAAVRYLAFGDFALNALENTRTIGHMQLWIEPTRDNLMRFNQSLDQLYGPRNATAVPLAIADDPSMRRMLTVGTGQVRVNLYPVIAGFTATQFTDAFGRAQKGQATLLQPGGQFDGSVAYRQLGLGDLYRNVQASTSYHRAWNLELIERYAGQRNITLSKPMQSPSNQAHISRSPQRINRNFNDIRQELDLEMVLQHYGYRLDTRKSQPNSPWRIYETGIKGDKQRLAVAALQGQQTKLFVDLNDPVNFRGDLFKFLEKMEHGNYRHIFEVIDQITGQSGYAQEKARIPALRQIPEAYFLKDTLLREQDLYQRYQLTAFTNTNYLNSRSLTQDTLYAPEFAGRIRNTAYQKDDKTIVNTAFPLYARDGRIVSLDVRNRTYKAFPEGERGEAIWHSNRFYTTRQELPLADGSRLPAGTVGTAYQTDDRQRLIFHLPGPTPEGHRIDLPVATARDLLQPRPVNRIVITESTIDALSFRQLNPEVPGEHRLYIATAGQPGGRQVGFIQDKLNENPTAQLLIAQDGDNPGLRFAINYLALDHPAENPDLKIKPYITYSAPARSALPSRGPDEDPAAEARTQTTPATEAGSRDLQGTNRLTLELRYPVATDNQLGKQQNEQFITKLVTDLNLFIRKYDYNNDPADKENKVTEFQRESLLDPTAGRLITRTVIHFPNDSVLLGKVLTQLTREIDLRQGQSLYQVIRPTRQQKDFNEVLQSRQGNPLPASHNLKLGEPPVIVPISTANRLPNQEKTAGQKLVSSTRPGPVPNEPLTPKAANRRMG